jgi:ketosteroid isomerase-like protein
VAIVQRFSTAVREGDVDEMARLLHDDFVAHEAGGLPYSGEYRGASGFLELLRKMNDAMMFDPGPFISEPLGESAVALRFSLTFTVRATGKSVTMNLVEVYTLRDEKIIDLDVYYKDPAALTALLGEVPAAPADAAGTS